MVFCIRTHIFIFSVRVVIYMHNKSRQKWVRGLFINFSHQGNKNWCELVINIPNSYIYRDIYPNISVYNTIIFQEY